ncbi:MAG: exodeoxyribonuclease VII large subunit [Bacteroidia bacterium]|nr:exodeoxyribonuclease VII large subunit [Bacteroidia bacterium]
MSDEPISLLELNSRIRLALSGSFPDTYWIIAEISEIRSNRTGHCYLELIEKNTENDDILARAKATIWSFTYRMLKPYFETSTGRHLEAGLKVLVNVSVEFHEQYGLSLNIKDIDPTYTLGDLARKRQEIIVRLEQEGVINMNRELEFPLVAQRIAVISSETAAGYGDFIDQLAGNSYGYRFHIRLFEANMQGIKAEESIIKALDRIYQIENRFDAVVIIRGGGSKAELSCFDGYDLAYHITQFPLPVITGIGHERDDSIADLVAHTRLKTPTAVAEFLVAKLAEFEETILEIRDNIFSEITTRLGNETEKMEYLSEKLAPVTRSAISNGLNNLALIEQKCKNDIGILLRNHSDGLGKFAGKIIQSGKNRLQMELTFILNFKTLLNHNCNRSIAGKLHRLDLIGNSIFYLDPVLVLKRGYSITRLKGKMVKSIKNLAAGDKISTQLSDGRIESVVV